MRDPTPTDLLSLTELEANYRGIRELTGLEYAKNLQTLSLVGNQLTTVRGLTGLPRLKFVDLQWNQVTDITGLSDLPNLETVILHKNRLTTVPALAGLPKLKNLHITDNPLTDISGLSSLTGLEYASLINNRISVIPPLSGLPRLKRLDLNANQIADISALSGLSGLEHLELFSNQITAIPSLAGLPKLTYLGLSKNRIADITGLSGLTHLTRLEAWGNQIQDISVLAMLSNLEVIELSSNRITDITVLSGLVRLTEVRLRENQITNIGSLILLPSLGRLTLDKNPLDRNTYLRDLPAFRAAKPYVYVSCDPCPWAWECRPYDEAADISQRPALRWTAGARAARHDIYFGENRDAVANATLASTGIYRGRQTLPEAMYEPNALDRNKTYFWRVDEIESGSDSIREGAVWSFTAADFSVVEDFELYSDNVAAGQAIFQTWLDGSGFDGPAPYRWGEVIHHEPNHPGNGTGSLVRNWRPPFAEQVIVHGGRQSMAFSYDNTGAPWYSETERTWTTPQDWTAHGADTLTLYFRGNINNSTPERLYLAIEDDAGRIALRIHASPYAVQATDWQEWRIPLIRLAAGGVDVTGIQKLYLGVGDRDHPRPGGTGKIYVDDIRVVKSAP